MGWSNIGKTYKLTSRDILMDSRLARQLLKQLDIRNCALVKKGEHGTIYRGMHNGQTIAAKFPTLVTQRITRNSEIAKQVYLENVGCLEEESEALKACMGIEGIPTWKDFHSYPAEFFANQSLSHFSNTLARIYGSGMLAREYIDGKPLSEVLSLFPQQREQLVRTVSEVEKRGVAFQDLHQPSNYVVGTNGLVYIIDLGYWTTHAKNTTAEKFETEVASMHEELEELLAKTSLLPN